MALKQCEQCSEMVDEAKAFCPECGHALVVEAKREVASNFDTFDGTIKLGDTMYNQMLTDMGLNISKSPDRSEKRVEVIAPVAAVEPSPQQKPVAPEPASNTKWWILGGAAAALLLLLLIAVILVFVFWSRIA